MARLDPTQLVTLATGVGHRAYEVQRDPAVQKVWREAAADIAVAASSVGRATAETRDAWQRTAPAVTGRPRKGIRAA